MLKSIHIKNIALIKELDLSFDMGLIVLTGETGAGKSIIIDSFNFVLGGRADKSLISHGEAEARVEAVFSIGKDIESELLDLGIESGGEIVILRSLTSEGKSDCRINGRVVTLGMLKGIASQIINIHGQHEHQFLLKVQNHIKTLDGLCGAELQKLKSEFLRLLGEYKDIKKEISLIGGSDEDRERNIDILEYQIREITSAVLNQAEEKRLEAERIIALNSERIMDNIGNTLTILNSERGVGMNVSDSLGKARQLLNSIQKFDDIFSTYAERLESVQIELDDVLDSLETYLAQMSMDMLSIDSIESRLDVYKELKRKYGKTIEEIDAFCTSAKAKLNSLKNSKDIIKELESKKDAVFLCLQNTGRQMTSLRKMVALRLKKETEKELSELGMKNAEFTVCFSSEDYSETAITQNGFDSIEFFFSANAGEPVKPLSKIISGGEMSRLMLALKVITSKTDDIDTLIFDEIDTGISGNAGTVVASKMAKISRSAQVICITHLAAIAAMADTHFSVSKIENKSKTITKVKNLNDEEMIEEISRLVGGLDISSHSLAHSRELKNWCKDFKKRL